MEFGMSRRIKPKEKYVRISMKEVWRNLDGLLKNNELLSYVVSFELTSHLQHVLILSRSPRSQLGPLPHISAGGIQSKIVLDSYWHQSHSRKSY